MKKNTAKQPAKKPAAKPKKATASKQEKPAQPGDTPKAKGLPPQGSLNNYGVVQMPPHAPSTPVFRLTAEQRPKLTAVELAALTGALHLPETREGAARFAAGEGRHGQFA